MTTTNINKSKRSQGMPEEATMINMSVAEFDVTTAEIAKLKDKYEGYLDKDISEPAEYKVVKSAEMDLKKLRISVDKRRKSLGQDAREYITKVNSKAKEIIEPIVELEKPLHDKRIEFDNAEEIARREVERVENERIEGITNRIAAIKSAAGVAIQKDADYILKVISKLRATRPESFSEFHEEARSVINESVVSLESLYNMKIAQETMEQEKAEREAREAEERKAAAAQQEIEIAKQREAQAKLDADREKLEAEKRKLAQAKAEQEQKEQAEKAKRKAAEEEGRRIAADAEAARARLEEQQKHLAEIVAALRKRLADMKLFSSNKKLQIFLDAVVAGEIDNLKFYL